MSFKCPSFIQSAELFALLERPPLTSELGHAFYLSYLFPLMAPSETLRPDMAFRGDPITEFRPQEEKALIAVRKHGATAVLATKCKFRRNIRIGRILMRPCLCGDIQRKYRRFLPAHALWPALRGRVVAGDPLFPAIRENSPNRLLKTQSTALDFDRGVAYSPHSFLRGATAEFKNWWLALASILKSGTWPSASYKNYMCAQSVGAIDVSALLIEGSGPDIRDSDHDIPKNAARPKRRLKRCAKSRWPLAPAIRNRAKIYPPMGLL